MSFEGYYQVLCKNGHSYTLDIYGDDIECSKCPICDECNTWWNIVNTTNGSLDDQGEQIDGYVELEILTEAKECTCSCCDNIHTSKFATYKIPKGIGHVI